MVNLNDIQVFVTTARKGTINAAARNLGVPASTVSRALTRLEKQVELQLVRRTTRGVSLTDAGRDYLEQCEATISQLEAAHEMLDSHRTKPHGTLRLSVPPAFAREFLAPMLRHFLADYPEIRLEIILHGGKSSGSLDDDLDFLIQIGKPKDSSLRVKIFPPVIRRLYASPKYAETNGLPAEPSALPEHSCIGGMPRTSELWHLESATENQTINLSPRISVADPIIQKRLTIDGFGIAQLPTWTALPELETGKLIVVLPEWQPKSLHYHALYAERSAMTPKIKVFLEFLERFIATEYDPRNGRYQSSDIFHIS